VANVDATDPGSILGSDAPDTDASDAADDHAGTAAAEAVEASGTPTDQPAPAG
jgi:hypothetical protein